MLALILHGCSFGHDTPRFQSRGPLESMFTMVLLVVRDARRTLRARYWLTAPRAC